jgi:hypothetical protein
MHSEGHPQAFVTQTSHGGTVFSFLPGHTPATVTRPDYQRNLRRIIASAMGQQPI